MGENTKEKGKGGITRIEENMENYAGEKRMKEVGGLTH